MVRLYVFMCVVVFVTTSDAQKQSLQTNVKIPTERPLNIAHRGSCGVFPEQTDPAFSYAIEQGADALECDVVFTRDLQLLCLHESWISSYTNIGDLYPEDRINTYFVADQGRSITDYFTVDFTLAELEEVTHKQKLDYRDPNYDFEFTILSFEELLEIIQASGKPVIIYAEIKDRIFQNGLDFVVAANTTIEDTLIEVLARYGYTDQDDPCIVQSFNDDSVKYVADNTNLKVSVLISNPLMPSNETLEEYAGFAHAISPNKRLVVTSNAGGGRSGNTDLVERAHAYGLQVHVWTFRNEDRHLLWDYEQDPYLEYMDFLQQDVDGIITDFPGTLNRLLEILYE